MNRTRILTFLFIFCISFSGKSQSRIDKEMNLNYSGKVVDRSTGYPLEYATIALISARDSSIVGGGITNDEGFFTFDARPGRFILKAQFVSYNNHEQQLNAPPRNGDVNIGTITLSPGSEILNEVVISGKEDIVQMQLDKRIFNVGENAANLGASAADILDNLPSVQVDIEGNISLRGNENVNVLIDGKPSSIIGLNSSTALRQIQGSMIERIEVVTNPSARYQAEGSAGIINIVLKKNKKSGLNGSIDVGAGYPTNFNSGVNLNYRLKKINLFTNCGIRYNSSPGGGESIDQYFLNPPDSLNFTERTRDHVRSGLSNNVRFGFDWFVNKKNTITSSILYRISDEENTTENIYHDFDLQHSLISIVDREDFETEKDYNQEYSLNYKKEYDKKGQELTAFAQYRSNFEIENSEIEETNTKTSDLLHQQFNNEEGEENLLFQTDYIQPIGKKGKIESGYRGSWRNTENNYDVQELQVNTWVKYDSLSNKFEYKEEIHAAYIIISQKIQKISYQAGLRSEFTTIDTHLKETNEKNSKNYFNFFPSIHFTYTISKGNDMQASYSRRLHRPRFRHLNPFSSYSDARNLRAGNPDLNPEFTDAYEIGFLKNWKTGSLLSSVFYNHTIGVVQRIRFTSANGVSTSTPYNLGNRNAYGLEFTASQDITKWWSMNASLNLFRAIIEGSAEGQQFDSDTYSWSSRLNTKMSFWENADFQMNLNYRGPRETTQGIRKAIYSLDLGLSKDLFNGNGTVTISGRDIFNTRKYRATISNEGMYSESEFQWRSRQFLVGLNYRINQKKSRRRGGRSNGESGGIDDGGGF